MFFIVRNHHLMIASAVVIALGLILRWGAEDWATVEFTTPEGQPADAVNHSKQHAFDWVGLALSLGGVGLLGYSVYVQCFGKRKAWRL